jgi:hypothetical protein
LKKFLTKLRVYRNSKVGVWNQTSVGYQINHIRGGTRELVPLPERKALEAVTLREQQVLVKLNTFH